MALYTQVHIGAEREIKVLIRSMHLMTAQAIYRLARSRIGGFVAHRVRVLVRILMTGVAKLHDIVIGEILRIIRSVWRMADRTILPGVCYISRLLL